MSKLYWVVLDGEDLIYAEDKGIISSYWVCLEPCNERICNALKCEEYGLKIEGNNHKTLFGKFRPEIRNIRKSNNRGGK